MSTFLHLGNRIVNVDHIVKAEWHEAKAEYKVRDSYDPNRGMLTIPADPEHVILTLSSIRAAVPDDYGNSDNPPGGSTSQTLKVNGNLARRLWDWFERRADIPNLEPLSTSDVHVDKEA